MALNVNTHVDDCVAVVVDPTHDRFGEKANILLHDWKEYGVVYAKFVDGVEEGFDDGWCEGDPVPQVIIIRRDDPKLEEFLERLPELKDELHRLKSMIGNRRFSEKRQEMADRHFRELVDKARVSYT